MTPNTPQLRRSGAVVSSSLSGFSAHAATAKNDSATQPAQHVGGNGRANPVSNEPGERVVDERGDEDAGDDRPRPAEAGGEHEREELRLVADLAERDDGHRDQEGFHQGTDYSDCRYEPSAACRPRRGDSPNGGVWDTAGLHRRTMTARARSCIDQLRSLRRWRRAGARSRCRGRCAAPVKTEHVEAELVAEQDGARSRRSRRRSRCASRSRTAGTRTGGTPAIRACRRRSRGSCRRASTAGDHRVAGAARAAGRAARQLRLRRRGAASRRRSRRPPTRSRGSDATLAARADWLVCKETCIPEGADLDARAAGRRRAPTPTPRWGTAHRRRARRAAAAARRLERRARAATARRSR